MDEIAKYILHMPPMRLVEELVSGDENQVTTALEIRTDSTFFDESLGGVAAWVGLEYMAQTAAVWVGLEDVRHQQPVQLGFLVSARQYEARTPVFRENEKLRVTIRRLFGEDQVVVFEGTICTAAGDTLAEANFTAYRPDDADAYLRGDI